MTNQTQELTGVEGFFTQLTEATQIVTSKLVEVAPEAAEQVISLVQIKGAFDLGLSVVFLAAAALSAFAARRFFAKSKAAKDYNEEFNLGMFGLLTGAFAAVFLMIALVNLFDFYTWLAVINPEGAIAYKALKAVGVSL